MESLRKIQRSFIFGLRGLTHAFETDKSFRLEILWGLPAYLIVGYILTPLSWNQAAWFWFSYIFILVVELINSSLERMLDRLHPDRHELIGHAKDLLAGAMVLAFVFATLTVGTLLVAHFL